MNAATEAQLETDIPALMDKAGVPGLSIAAIRGGRTVWTESFGVRNSETKKPVTGDTRFNVGSLSKPVFAYGVLKLVDAGKLKLDEPLAPYLPKESTEGDSRFKQITARLVLSHRTGFPNWPGDGKQLTIHFTPGERGSAIPARAWCSCRKLWRKLPASRSTTTCKKRSLGLSA
jgi:CubicO group peptidase (beta-lactamase class C family)